MKKKISVTKIITIGILIFVVVLTIGWDIIAYFITPAQDDTISTVVWGFSKKHPSLPMFIGILSGHLFWPTDMNAKRKKISVIGLAIYAIIFVVLNLFKVLPSLPSIIYFMPGLVLGHFLWGRKKVQ